MKTPKDKKILLNMAEVHGNRNDTLRFMVLYLLVKVFIFSFKKYPEVHSECITIKLRRAWSLLVGSLTAC